MIPLTIFCLITCGANLPIDTRDIDDIVVDEYRRQFPTKEPAKSCYVKGKFYKQCPPNRFEQNEEFYSPGIGYPGNGY